MLTLTADADIISGMDIFILCRCECIKKLNIYFYMTL